MLKSQIIIYMFNCVLFFVLTYFILVSIKIIISYRTVLASECASAL